MTTFSKLTRQRFRQYFQPSRIVIALLPAPTASGVNPITLCFHMHCSYKPTMMAFSIFKAAYSYKLIENTNECVLAVPGERIAEQTLQCGIASGTTSDKIADCNFNLIESQDIQVPSLREAIANIELRIVQRIKAGDHITAIGEVVRFGVDTTNRERNLISVGPKHEGYEVLVAQGIHRIAVPRRAS